MNAVEIEQAISSWSSGHSMQACVVGAFLCVRQQDDHPQASVERESNKSDLGGVL